MRSEINNELEKIIIVFVLLGRRSEFNELVPLLVVAQVLKLAIE